MKTTNLIKYIMTVAVICIVFTACKKKDEVKEEIVDKDTSGAADNALAENTFSDVSNISDQGASGSLSSYLSTNNNGSGDRSHCATVDTTSSGNTHTITINFGTTPCLCDDGRYRSGVIKVSYSGNYHALGSIKTITFTNYTVNGNTVNGNHTITNLAPAGNGPRHKITVYGTIVKANSGGTINWTSNRTREWTLGYTTTTGIGHQLDDVFSISGTANGTHSNGNGFNETASNLKIHMNCDKLKIESGQLDITPAGGKPTRHIDFGTDGTCDYTVTVTINGISYTVTMQ